MLVSQSKKLKASMTRSSEIQLYLPGILDAFQHWHRDYAVEIDAPNLLHLMQTHSSASKTHVDYKVGLYQQVWGNRFSLDKHYAAVCYEADFKKRAPDHLYLASPINLESGLTSLTVAPQVIDDIHEDEWAEIYKSLNEYFAEQQWRFELSDAGRLYVCFPEGVAPNQLVNVDDILGQNLLDVMDTQGAIKWHARLNEIQMLLFSLPFNQQREVNRQLMVNGLWIWGGGARALEPASQSIDYIIAKNEEGRSIAYHTSADLLPKHPDHLPKGKGVIIADDCLKFYQAGDIDAWQHTINELDNTLFATLAKQVDNITLIHSCDGYQWRPKKKSLLHFFQKKRSKLTDFFIGGS
ncbi:MAG: Unknown protein [uncultured Thiotrichaceae bacterium]|uniref:Regulatory protein, RpfE type n=1 Tax=uncultured Thiotrichaceae bacterium TaxID=298394 RepID=A0A6S6SJA0_9GAMM|nr:MAG: Unknown protein [uncultured Thiotrichaceae bacterium]